MKQSLSCFLAVSHQISWRMSQHGRFGEYFALYADKKCQWAVCFRKDANINTNMYVEAFHHTLK